MPTLRVLCLITAAIIIMIPNLAPAQAAKHIPVGDEFDASPAPAQAQSAVRARTTAGRPPAVRPTQPHDPVQRHAARPPAQSRHAPANVAAADPGAQADGRPPTAGQTGRDGQDLQAQAQTFQAERAAPAPPPTAPPADTQHYAPPQQPVSQPQPGSGSPTVGFTLGNLLSGFSNPRESMERALQFAMGEINSSTGGPGPRWARQKRWE